MARHDVADTSTNKANGIETDATAQPAVDPRNRLNDLTSRQWVAETVSVWLQRGLGSGHEEAQIERQHPAPFSFQDVMRLIQFFTKHGQTVLDPFVGVGSTLKAAAIAGRRGIGIELNARYAQLCRDRLAQELAPHGATAEQQTILEGDARELLLTLPENSVHCVITSPPYWGILHKTDHKATQERLANGLDANYGHDDRDLANIPTYDQFVQSLADVLASCSRPLVAGGYLGVVVGDFRHGSKYHMFHADLASAMEQHGFSLHGLTVLYQNQKRVFPYGYPYSFVPNMHHQYILIMQSPKGSTA